MRRTATSKTVWVVAFLIIAFIGFADSVYLTASHYIGELPTCTIIEGCDEVALSEYSTIGPVPVSLLGVLFYALMLVWSVVWLDLRRKGLFRLMPLVTVPAFLFSMWLVYLMFFVIDAICIYCLVSSGTTTLLMLLSLYFRKRF
ncbi:vitamin K epoxide reductase family protein [Balneolales bacterium ANBcel1]|nr:vitamin K epoxide reductase family protein [Balneolales bacterium ANBcel1]